MRICTYFFGIYVKENVRLKAQENEIPQNSTKLNVIIISTLSMQFDFVSQSLWTQNIMKLFSRKKQFVNISYTRIYDGNVKYEVYNKN